MSYAYAILFNAYGKLSIGFVLLHIKAIQKIFIQSWGSNFRFIFISPSPLRALMRVHECHTCFSHSQLHLLLPIRRSPRMYTYVCVYILVRSLGSTSSYLAGQSWVSLAARSCVRLSCNVELRTTCSSFSAFRSHTPTGTLLSLFRCRRLLLARPNISPF